MLSAIAYVGEKATAPVNSLESDPGIVSLLLRLAGAMRFDRVTASERVAADLIEANGGRLTDSVEREIGRRFQSGF